VVGKAVKPSEKDKNVMPYELQDFIADNVPGMTSVIRYGGDIDTLKRMISAGFPVVVEKGIYELDVNGKYGWMGHYAFVTGYDDTTNEIIYQDTYQPEPKANPGPNRHIKESTFLEGWRAFNYVFVVVYPSEKENQIMSLLGPLADEVQALLKPNRRPSATLIATLLGSMWVQVMSPCSNMPMQRLHMIMHSISMPI
jgi:hypothetical protein